MEGKPKSVYLRGAENGVFLGLYFCVMFICMTAGEKIEMLGLLSTVMMVGVPFLIYAFMRKTYIDERGYTIYAALWMQGIVAFAGGGLILAVFVYGYLKWFDTTFIQRQVALLIDVYGRVENSDTQNVVDIFRQMQQRELYPAPRDIITQLILLSVFSGSVVSMVMALLVRIRKLTK